MRVVTQHIENLGRLVAVLFFVANAGFTAVLDCCSIDGVNACAVDSCAEQMACGGACDQTDSDCDNVVVAGGFISAPMVFEAVPETETSRFDLLSSVPLQPVVLSEPPRISGCSSSSPYGDDLQHTVEKYVLNASFLM